MSRSTRKFASGGFPEDGLFFANHHELVGKFSNGKTAVANNEQIIVGIEDGVYRAMSAVISSTGERGDGQEINIYLGNEKIYSGFTKWNKQLQVVTGGRGV